MCFLAYLCEAHITKILRDKESLLFSKAIGKRIIKETINCASGNERTLPINGRARKN